MRIEGDVAFKFLAAPDVRKGNVVVYDVVVIRGEIALNEACVERVPELCRRMEDDETKSTRFDQFSGVFYCFGGSMPIHLPVATKS